MEKEAVECSAANEPAAGSLKSVKRKEMRSRAGRGQERPVSRRKVQETRRQETRQKRGVPEEGFLQAEQEQEERFQEERYSEGEPRNVENGEKRRSPAERRVSRETDGEDQPALKEAAIRQILEEFLA